jgi:hypothetical protein
MSKTSVKMGLSAIILLVIGVFMILVGIKGIIDYNSSLSELKRAMGSLFGGGNKDMITLIIAILDIAAGSILVLGLFLSSQVPLLSAGTTGVIFYWAARIVYNSIFLGIDYGKRVQFRPDFISWLLLLLTSVIILLALIKVVKE